MSCVTPVNLCLPAVVAGPMRGGTGGTSYPGPGPRGPGEKVFRAPKIAKTSQNEEKTTKTVTFGAPSVRNGAPKR